MKKIILIVPSLAKGGAERVMILLYHEFEKQYNTTLVIFHGPVQYDVTGKVINLQTPVGNLVKRLKNNFVRIYKLLRLFKEIKPDIVLSFLGNVQPILTFYPLFVSVRCDPGIESNLGRLFYKTIYKLNNVNSIITPSENLSKILKANFALKRIKVIRNPLDIDYINKKQIEKFTYGSEYILAVGRLIIQKRFDVLIKSFQKSGISDKVKLLIIGEGELRLNLEKLIKDKNLSSRVKLLGQKENPYVFMKNAKFFVLSSEYEGFPNVLIEALACGTPVISTDCNTGPSEIIKNKYNGLLVPVNDIGALSYSMKEIYRNNELYNALKKNTRPSIVNYDLKLIANEWFKIFKW